MGLADTLRDRLGVDLRDLTGARVTADVPISTDLANRLLADRLRGHPQIAAIRIEPRAEDAVVVEIVPRVRLMPPLRVHARIERQPDFPDDPTLFLRWSMPAAGPLAMFAGPVLAYFKKMPPGIRMDGDRLAVDLRDLLHDRGHGDVLALIRRGAIHTRPGGFALEVDLAL